MRKGGVPDVEAAAKMILKDWNTGVIAYYTKPPTLPNVHISAEVVSAFSKEIDVDALTKAQVESLKGLPEAEDAFAIVCVQLQHADAVG
jgi:hypothetical protein